MCIAACAEHRRGEGGKEGDSFQPNIKGEREREKKRKTGIKKKNEKENEKV